MLALLVIFVCGCGIEKKMDSTNELLQQQLEYSKKITDLTQRLVDALAGKKLCEDKLKESIIAGF